MTAAKPRLLDAFCKAGGCTRGYQLAGFHVTGVDIEPQPNYIGDEFVQADAVEFIREHGHEFDAIHASPPCQDYSTTRSLHAAEYPRLIGAVREAMHGNLRRSPQRPYVIENVAGARSDMLNPVTLCGSSFGLGVRRHRLFETSWPVMWPPQCRHDLQPQPIDVTGTGARRIGDRTDGRGGNSRKPRNLVEARAAMGIDWMTRPELSEAIPPAYTEWLGTELLEHLREAAA